MLVVLCSPSCGRAAAFSQTPVPERPVFLKNKEAGALLVEKPEPKYPPLAKINFIQGRVRVRILVNEDGRVVSAHALSGHPFLAAAALAALAGWRYRPYTTPKGSQEFVTDVQVIFALRIKDPTTVPSQPEEDLERQVRPPRVLSRPDNLPQASSIHIRVLVSSEGKALDVDPAPGFPAKFEVMRERFASWKFQPARFGSLAVPWYLEVEVPSESWPAAGEIPGEKADERALGVVILSEAKNP
ncbi:MAG: hypothetical protein DMG21_11330 [Acidobacteria bacterium]|nr:MAG: hypothetical protein DMG21_11330 [Acidobacteriota bacterium]